MSRCPFISNLCLLARGLPVVGLAVLCLPAIAAETGRTQYLDVVQRAADALLENARDTHGPQQSEMILSVLDRRTGKPIEKLPKAPAGVRQGDRTGVGGSNASLQQDLYRVLHHLSRITGNPRYSKAAHQALVDFARITQHPVTGFFAWGEHLYWNCIEDRAGDNKTHEPKRKFITYAELLEAEPERALHYARGLWEHQIADRQTGDFSRHAAYDKHKPGRSYDFAKEGSYFIDTWSHAYQRTQDAVFRRAVDVLAKRYQGKMNARGLMDFDSSRRPDRVNLCWVQWMVSLAVESHDAASRMDGESAALLRNLARRQDDGFLRLEHFAGDPDRGFIAIAFTDTGKVRADALRKTDGYSNHWGLGYGLNTTSMFALLANTRQAQLGAGPAGDGYRKLLLEASELYRNLAPDPLQNDIWAGEYGMAVFVELAAYRLTKKAIYLETARRLADTALATLWSPDGVLPRASSGTDYYDVITYPDTLLLALLALHEHLIGQAPQVPISDLVR